MPQFLCAVSNPLLGCVVVRGCFSSIGLLVLTRLEEPLSAGTIYIFVLGHTI